MPISPTPCRTALHPQSPALTGTAHLCRFADVSYSGSLVLGTWAGKALLAPLHGGLRLCLYRK